MSVASSLGRSITTQAFDRRLLRASLLLLAIVLPLAFRWEIRDLLVMARYRAIETFDPLTWPREPFNLARWNALSRVERHVMVRDLGSRMRGASRSEAAAMLGEKDKGDLWTYPLHEVSPNGISYAFVVELENDVVIDARVRLAWFCP